MILLNIIFIKYTFIKVFTENLVIKYILKLKLKYIIIRLINNKYINVYNHFIFNNLTTYYI